MKKTITILLTLVFLLTLTALPALAADSSKSITTNGEGIIKAAPEIASIYLSIEGQGKTAKEARDQNAVTTNNVIKQLKKLGVAAEEIQSVSFTVFPIHQYNPGKNQNKISGYQASSQLIVKTSKLDRVGFIIDTAIDQGVNNVANVAYSVKDEEAWTLKALEKATTNAQKKAKSIAQALGLSIKGVNSVNEHGAFVALYNMDVRLMKEQATGAGDSTPFQAPQFIEIRANVSISFAI